MKKITYILMICIGLTMLASCELETSSNGNLDGYWHLESIDTLSTGGRLNLKDAKLFWAFENNLLEIIDNNNYEKGDYLLRFEKTSDSLSLSEPYAYNREKGDVKVDSANVLSPFGVNSLNEHFKIESFSSSKMILSTNVLRLQFKKL